MSKLLRLEAAWMGVWLLLVGHSLNAAETTAPASYAQAVLADKPVAYWRFEAGNLATHPESAAAAVLEKGKVRGQVQREEAGPDPARFPLFDAKQHAIQFSQPGAITVADPGDNSPLDFARGDSITIEAWVNVSKLSNGQQMYVVGKGRTKNEGFADENQNYALRLAGIDGQARLSFLFRSADNRRGHRDDYHRWNSSRGFAVKSGWHHIAVSYTFGAPESIRGYVDGQPTSGTWDYGGATDEAPVVDNDELWIGSALGLSASNGFQGSIDEVALYRAALAPERMAARWRAIEPKPYITNVPLPEGRVLIEIFEGIIDAKDWSFILGEPTERFSADAFFWRELPHKYTARGVRDDRSNPLVVRATAEVVLGEGPMHWLVRSRGAARLFVDQKPVAQIAFPSNRTDGHQPIYTVVPSPHKGLRPLAIGDQEQLVSFTGDGRAHRVTFEFIVGGGKRRAELGETFVSVARPDEAFRPLNERQATFASADDWDVYEAAQQRQLVELNRERRMAASREYAAYWSDRHEKARVALKALPSIEVPQLAGAAAIHNDIDRFIQARLDAAQLKPMPLADDWTFLRRVTLDTLGRLPNRAEVEQFWAIEAPTRRSAWIDRLLSSDEWADHWVGYWQDVLAENPNILNPTLNNTGPFRWWIYESFLDNKPFDRFATELILMEGSVLGGGAGGFAMATQNDVPMAAKAHVIGQAFLAMEMKCARCHDAPYHDFRQRELFSLAAMLNRAPQAVPKTSSIPVSDEALQSLLVKVTLKPGENVPPEWPFAELLNGSAVVDMLQDRNDRREQLAALVTSSDNHRFAQVIVNRLWHRYLGRGLIEPVDDWQQQQPVQRELFAWLERELVRSGYDLKQLARLILGSHVYQRQCLDPAAVDAERASLFAGPIRRRMSAEQIVDSLLSASGKTLNVEDMNIDVDGSRRTDVSINLGAPSRAWQFTSLSNERDRPSLSLPAAQTVVNVLEAFDWRGARQDPRTQRAQESTAIQPAVLANGVFANRATQLSDDSQLTALAIAADSPQSLIEALYATLLTRRATASELALFVPLLQDGFERRIVSLDAPRRRGVSPKQTGVSWSNHLKSEANQRKVQLAVELEAGDPPTAKLATEWRERAEDLIWTLLNSPEFVMVP